MTELLFALTAAPSAAVLGFGFLIGLKHAIEADHVAAVTTIVSERRNVWSSALVGAFLGLGHSLALLAAGVLVLMLGLQISESVERWLEMGVGVMLTLLGLNVLRKLVQGATLHFHTHEHGGRIHAHPHMHDPVWVDESPTHHNLKLNSRSVAIGMVHGLAGSGALMLAVIPAIGSKSVAMLYIAIFGVGSIGGMVLMSFLVGLPFHLTAARFSGLNRILQGAAGLVSIVLGLLIVYEKAFSHAA